MGKLTIAVAAILAGEADDALGQQILVGPEDGPIALCAPGLAEDAAGKALRDAVALDGLCHRLPSPLGARGLEVSLGSVLQNGLLDGQIGHDALEPLVLPLQFLQPPGLVTLQAVILLAPAVVGDIRDAGFFAGLVDRLPFAHQHVDLPQFCDRLLGAILLVRHLLTPSSKLKNTTFNLAQKKPVTSMSPSVFLGLFADGKQHQYTAQPV